MDILMSHTPPLCLNCAHLDRASRRMVCTAFPSGIPRPILVNEHDHRKPYPGDNGIRYAAVVNKKPPA